jgi:hypothetical protein
MKWVHRRIVEFYSWYFSLNYQVPFTFSILTLSLVLGTAIPLLFPFTAFFFLCKFYIEFKERIMHHHVNQLINGPNKEQDDAPTAS